MFFLVATILLNVWLFVLFKLFPRFNVDTLQAIVFNYIVCVITGTVYLGRFPIGSGSPSQPWFWWAVLLGAGFIALFNLIGYCTRQEGLTVTTIANKLSLVIPVVFSWYLYDEELLPGELVGVLLAIPAVYFSTRKKRDEGGVKKLWLPALLFVGSGLLDTLVKYVEEHFLSDAAFHADYTIHTFATAAVLGSIVLVYLLATGASRFHYRNIIAGVVLGVPNFFSIYCLIRLLHSDFLQSSAAIPVNNIGIVLLSTLVGILFFKERSGPQRIVGVVLSLIAILLIAFSDYYGS